MTMSESTSTRSDPLLSAVATIPVAAIGVGEVGCDAERFVEHALGLRSLPLLRRGAVDGKVLVQRGSYHFGQGASVAGTKLLDLTTLILG